MSQIPIVLYGVGAIGREIGRAAAGREDLRLVGAVDLNPGLIGRDLGTVLGLPAPLGLLVVPDLDEIRAPAGCVTLHATSSSLSQVAPQLERLVGAKYNVVSTCEELVYPFFHHPGLAESLDAVARANGVTLLGTGINPGFVMDTLPLTLTAICRRVDRIRVVRSVPATTRREPLQRKIGVGLSREAFDDGVAAGRLGHVGLPQSVAAVAYGLRWTLDRIEEETTPVMATESIRTPFAIVEPGQVAGLRQVARGWARAEERVTLDLTMAVDVPAAVDLVVINGDPGLEATIAGIHGDAGTAAIVLNAVRPVVTARPGLRTMVDLVPLHR